MVALDKRIESLAESAAGEAVHATAAEGSSFSSNTSSIERLEVSRLKLQRDRKLALCAALRDELEAMRPAHLFCSSTEQLAQITRFAKHAQKKKVYYWVLVMRTAAHAVGRVASDASTTN